MGSVVDLVQTGRRRLRIYLTGDTLPYPGLEEIAERFPDIDAMLIHLGGTRLAGVLLTMDGRQGAYVTELIRARLTLPVHYDDYGVFTSSLPAFTNAAAARGLTAGLQPWARGETVQVAYRDDDA